MKAFLPALAVSALLAGAVSAKAQDAPPPQEDWVLTSIPERKATLALAEFTSGVTLVARCIDGAYDLFITGLPEAPLRATTRDLGLSVGEDAALKTTVWTVGEDRTTAFSRLPAMVARQLAEGGELQIVAQGPDHRRYRFIMALNPSSTALEQTLTACGRPLIDPRDKDTEGDGRETLPALARWEIVPRPRFPAPVGGRSPTEGYAVLSCGAENDGRLVNCQIESEWPRGYGLGREALRSVDRARLRLNDEAAAAGRRPEDGIIVFSINFRMD